MKRIDDAINQLNEMKQLLKRAPEGVNPEKHERCVKDVKQKGHDVGSAHAICTSSMAKGAAQDLDRQVEEKKKEYADINNKMPDPMKTNLNIATKDAKLKIKKDEGQYEASSQYVKHHDGQWRKVLNVKDDGKPHSEGGGNWYHLEGVKDPVHQNQRGPLASGAMLNAGVKKSDCDDMKKSGYGADKETGNFLEHFNPATKHPKEPTAGMPKGTKAGEKTTSTGFKLKLVKALADAGYRESALLLKNWDEMDDIAKAFAKSNYGPKGMGLYNAGDNQRRKASNTGESYADIGQNKNVKRYTTSASSMQAAHEAKARAEAKKNPAPVKTMKDMSPEQIKEIEMRYAEKAEDGGDTPVDSNGTNTDKDFRSSLTEERCVIRKK